MTAKRFSSALGCIGESYVDEALTYTAERRKSAWVRWVSMAACLLLIVTVGVVGTTLGSPDTPDIPDNIISYFVITAHAANGESTDLTLSDSCFNSAPAKEGNGFGVDMPIFHFSVRPSDLKNNEAVYDRFDISISYNGTPVKDKDEHIHVAYLISMHSSNKPWSYSITGWFTEPTDIIVNILDKESREIVETITVNVNYVADKQEYALEITNLTTKFSGQKEAVKANNVLMSYLFREGYVTNYPAWFGGCYIEGNKLYVKLVSPSEEEMKAISLLLAPYKKVVVYKNTEMSMSDLQAYADQTALDLEKQGYEVTSWYVDSVTGNVVISVLEKDFEAAVAWVDAALQNGNIPPTEIRIGDYVSVDLGREVIEFCAEPFMQDVSLSWMYSFDVRIDGGDIYLNDILYEKVSYVEAEAPDYGKKLMPSDIVDESVTEVLDKINSQKGYFILETESESKAGKKLAMYVIDDTYYFIRFYENGTVMRMHSGTVQ